MIITSARNPILAEFRRSAPWDLARDAATELTWLEGPHPLPVVDADADELDHARRVLARIVRLSQGHGTDA